MLAIIPARGESKGLPGKNMKKMLGKPLIAYTVEAAKKSKYIDDILISTDSPKIVELAVNLGAICPFMRPDELAADSSLVIDTYIYTIDRLEREYDYDIREFCGLYITSPLRTAEDIDNAISMFWEKDADSVISYTHEAHPISWHKYIREDNSFENIFDCELNNRQAIRPTYYPNGAIYIFKTDIIRERKFYTEKSFAYLMPRERSVDIDTLDDFEYAEFLMKQHADR